MQLAAADPSGDRALVGRAAGRLGIPVQAADPAAEAGLVEFGGRVRFRHPLARSAAYRSASFSDRQQLHAALAEVTDPIADPDRRAWHRAQAAAGPDEQVAAELERSAGRAQARGGLAAAAAFLERAVALTADPARHAERALAAAQASLQAGAFGKALELLATAEAGPLDEFASARVDLLRGQIAFASGLGSDAPPLLLKAAKRLEPLNRDLARDTYLSAWMAASFAGHLAGAGDLWEVSRAAQALPPPKQPPRPLDLLLDGLALLVIDGPGAAAPALRQAASAFASADAPAQELLQFGLMAHGAAIALWDEDCWRAILVRQVRLARDVGALDQLPVDLSSLAHDDMWRGDFEAADSLIAEANAVCEATGSRIAPFAAMLLAALRGNQAEVAPLIEATLAAAEAGGQGGAATHAHWVAAILHNGLGRYADALAAAEQATQDAHLWASTWALPELIEAAARTGNTQVAPAALERLAETTQAGGTDFGLGLEARCRALLSRGDAADDWYREAIDRLGRTRLRPDLARAHLLYGEWLRREGRRARRARAAAHRARHVRRDGDGGVRRARPQGADRHGGEGAPAQRGDARPAHAAGGADRPAGPRRPHQPGDRRRAVLVRAHGRMAPGQGIYQAGHRLPPGAARRAGEPGEAGPAGLAGGSVVGGLAAVDVQDLAGDVGRGLQEQDAVPDGWTAIKYPRHLGRSAPLLVFDAEVAEVDQRVPPGQHDVDEVCGTHKLSRGAQPGRSSGRFLARWPCSAPVAWPTSIM